MNKVLAFILFIVILGSANFAWAHEKAQYHLKNTKTSATTVLYYAFLLMPAKLFIG